MQLEGSIPTRLGVQSWTPTSTERGGGVAGFVPVFLKPPTEAQLGPPTVLAGICQSLTAGTDGRLRGNISATRHKKGKQHRVGSVLGGGGHVTLLQPATYVSWPPAGHMKAYEQPADQPDVSL